jgi:hypothetical protein
MRKVAERLFDIALYLSLVVFVSNLIVGVS